MSVRSRSTLAGLIATGVVIRIVIAALTAGDPFDMGSFALVRDALGHGALGVYSSFAAHGIDRWPYPPLYFPWIWLAGRLAAHGILSFGFLLRVPPILADAAIAWLVQDTVGRLGHGDRARLVGAAGVALGPSFIVISGYHGQFDSVSILPGVLALNLWVRGHGPRRALLAGLLIGIGGALKTVPLLLVLALAPSARSRRELGVLVGAAAAVVVAVFVPFALAGTLPSAHVLSYRGLPGAGDLSLAAQPDLAELALGVAGPSASGLTSLLSAHGTILILVALLVVAWVGYRGRPGAPVMAVLVWLTVYAFGINFFFQYLVWGMPFFLIGGYVRSAIGAQWVLLLPELLFYLRPWHSMVLVDVYATIMIGAWLAALAACLGLARRVGSSSGYRARHGDAAAGEPGIV